MANNIWQDEERKFLDAISNVQIPNDQLENVASLTPHSISDCDNISEGGGCYWIWTNEPVLHSLHKNKTPAPFNNGEIIYNGIAKDDVRGRIRHHLFGVEDAGWSGISVDIYFGSTTSYRKKALSPTDKVPYIKERIILSRGSKKLNFKKGDEVEKFKPIRTTADLLNIRLSESEKQFLESNQNSTVYFRNGINITEEKHRSFEYCVYYITGLNSLYLDFIEKKWREDFGLPKLCSYSSGR